jgi:hypothetical protein
VGGSAHDWRTGLDDGLVAGSPIELNLVMTKFGGEPATIGYEAVIATG